MAVAVEAVSQRLYEADWQRILRQYAQRRVKGAEHPLYAQREELNLLWERFCAAWSASPNTTINEAAQGAMSDMAAYGF